MGSLLTCDVCKNTSVDRHIDTFFIGSSSIELDCAIEFKLDVCSKCQMKFNTTIDE